MGSKQNTRESRLRPLVSVIIPTHNRFQFVQEAINSVAEQEGTGEIFDVEIIVVDDASSDETPDLPRRFPDVHFIRFDKNQGASAARNAGIKAAKGEYIAFLDDDDLFLPHKLKLQVPLLESRPDVGVVYGQISISGDATTDAWPKSAPSGNVFGELLLLTDDFMSPDALLVRREAFHQAGYFDESLPTMEHYDMYLRLAFHVRFLFMPVVVGHGRFSKSGKWNTNIKNRNNERVLPHIVERALAMLPNDESKESLRRQARVALFSTIIRQRWRTETVGDVHEYLLSTLDKYPWMVSEPAWTENLHSIAHKLALHSSTPISTVRSFWKEIRTAALIDGPWKGLRARRLLAASIWRGAASALWRTRSYPVAARAAATAILCDPAYIGRLIFFKR